MREMNLQEHWRVVRLGDTCNIIMGQSPLQQLITMKVWECLSCKEKQNSLNYFLTQQNIVQNNLRFAPKEAFSCQ